jgi:hypothetical protein
MLSLPVFVISHRRECRLLTLPQSPTRVPIYDTYAAAWAESQQHPGEPAILQMNSLAQLREWLNTAHVPEVCLARGCDTAGQVEWTWIGLLTDFLDRLGVMEALEATEFAGQPRQAG